MIGKDPEIASYYLKKGLLVGIPTETVYGLAANAFDEGAVSRVFEAKKRPFHDPLIVHVPSLDRVEDLVCSIPKLAKKLVEAFWPGPLTLLLPKSEKISPLITSNSPLVAIRNPRHPLTLELLLRLEFPLVAPSANPFGYISPTKPQHVADQLKSEVAYILDGGPCLLGIESTIVGVEEDRIILYRQGAVSEEQLMRLGPVVQKNKGPAPGLLKSHYAPRKPLKLGFIEAMLGSQEKVAVLSFQKSYSHPSIVAQKALSPRGNLDEAAHNLFGYLRDLDQLPVSLILAEKVPNHGIGRAINDRLEKAAAKKELN